VRTSALLGRIPRGALAVKALALAFSPERAGAPMVALHENPPTMRCAEALRILREHSDVLRRDHHVGTISIFGSVARDEAHANSDVDVLVEFDRPVGLFDFIGLQMHLTEILGCKVDLATPDALHHRMREKILSEAIRAS
jgi:uncharacterized protein